MMMPGLLDHLWQSTLFAVGIVLLMPLFRRQCAALRFWLWFTASMKFLLPFSLLTWLSGHVLAPELPASMLSTIRPVVPSLLGDAPLMAPAPASLSLLEMAMVVWGLGMVTLALHALSRWLDLQAAVRGATTLPMSLPVPVKTAPSFLEPGLVGLLRPVILLPKGLAQQLEEAELNAILAHELSHLKRRDNLLAALHMLVEGLFWFHPLVWWLGARLMEERERACDEAVLRSGTEPRSYAEGILKTCRFYVQSPLACASGVSGALEMRLGAIMNSTSPASLPPGKGLLLVLLGIVVLALPLAAGTVAHKPMLLFRESVQPARIERVAFLSIPRPSPRPDADPYRRPVAATSRAQEASVGAPQSHRWSLPSLVINLVLDIQPPALPAADPSRVCRPPQRLPDSHLKGPEVCLTADEWAQLKAQHQDIGADGHSLVATDYDKWQAIAGHRCDVSQPFSASNGWGAGIPACF